jgi:hypothetical protein
LFRAKWSGQTGASGGSRGSIASLRRHPRRLVPSIASASAISTSPDQGPLLSFPESRAMHRTGYPAASSSGISRPMYPDAPVTRQRNGDGPGRDDSNWRFPAGLSFWPCVRSARTPRSLPSRPGGAVSPYGRMGHGVQRRQRGDGQAAGPAAVRWPAAARSAAGQIEKPTCSASLPLLPAWRPGPGRPALMCGTSSRLDLCISGVADSQVGAQPGMSHCLRGATRNAAR